MKKILLLACVAAIACGDDDVPTADAGPSPDGSIDVGMRPDTGPVPDTGVTDAGPAGNICDPGELENVTASAGMVVSTIIDTSMARATPEPLENCGNELTGQIVLAIAIPGADANQVIEVSTVNEGSSDIDTILDFRTDCATEGMCFDDADGGLFSRGTIVADGGSTVFALISGYAATDEGVIEVTTEILGTAGAVGDACDALPCQAGLLCNDLDVCQAPAALGEACATIACEEGLVCGVTEICETAEAPVLTAATTVRYDNIPDEDMMITSLGMGLTGTDANGDVDSFNFTFLDAAGADFDFLGEGGDLTFVFGLEDADGLAMFMEAAFVNAGPTADYAAAAVGFRISLNDSAGLESNEIMGTITAGTPSAVGGSCAFTSLCDPTAMLICGVTDICEAPAAPVLTAATALRYDNLPAGEDMLTIMAMGLTGTDSNGDVVGFNFTFTNAAGEDFDFNDDMMPTLEFGLNDAFGETAFMEAAFVNAGDTAMFPAEAVAYRITVTDSAGLESNEITGTIAAGMFSAVGAACGFTEICDPGPMLTCNDMDVCAAP